MRRASGVSAGLCLLGMVWGLACVPSVEPAKAPAVSPAATAPSAAVEPKANASSEPATPTTPSASSAPSASASAPQPPGNLPGYRIDPKALEGCRAPDEPGCASCCDSSQGACEVLSSPEDWSQPGMGDPWYNARSVGCPTTRECRACASCTKRDEAELAARLPAKCDCKTTKIGIDPCFMRGSCACECSRLEALTRSCPAAP